MSRISSTLFIFVWDLSTAITQVHSFLSFCNYCHKFIRNYVQIAKTLYFLITGNNAKRKTNVVGWTDKSEQAFCQLKEICSETPILVYADYTKIFKVHTDTSEKELGAVLYQDQDDGTTRVIAYISQNLPKSKRRYHSSKLEYLALKWCVHEQFHEYLYGEKFEVYTDNNPLTYILTSTKLDATGQRWVASLANYDFTIHYQSGKQNVEADALSRIKQEHDDALVIKAIMAKGFNADTMVPYPFDPKMVYIGNIDLTEVPKLSGSDWQREQSDDVDIGPVVELVKGKVHVKKEIHLECVYY